MWQRDQVDAALAARDARGHPDLFDQRARWQKLLDGQTPDWDDQLRAEHIDLAFEPRPALRDLRERRHAVAALGILARKTAAHGGHVHALAKLRFVQTERLE